jgi:hypothetical protein
MSRFDRPVRLVETPSPVFAGGIKNGDSTSPVRGR